MLLSAGLHPRLADSGQWHIHRSRAQGSGTIGMCRGILRQACGWSRSSATDEDSAADIAAKALGLRHRDELRISYAATTTAATPRAKTKAPLSRYMYVTYSLPRKLWFAQRRGEFLGQFDSEEVAAKSVVKAGWASSLDELRSWRQECPRAQAMAAKRQLKAESEAQPKAKSKKAKVEPKAQPKAQVKKKAQVIKKAPGKLTRARVRDLWFIYRDAIGGTREAVVPGDLQDSRHMIYRCADMSARRVVQSGHDYAGSWMAMQ